MKISKEIKEKINKLPTVQERLEYLDGMFKGETAYLVTCGPTLTTHAKAVLMEKLKDKLVICVKQSINYLNEICDFHIMSVYNYQDYAYKNDNTVSIWQFTKANMDDELFKVVKEYNKHIDIYFPIVSYPWVNYSGTIAYTGNFDSWKKLKTDVEVLWGPGILYEGAFPLCYLLGVKRIVTIGWDIGDLSIFEQDNIDWNKQHASELYNVKVSDIPSYEEIKNVIRSTSKMYEWLKKEEIEVNILSDTNPADKRFKRITVDEL